MKRKHVAVEIEYFLLLFIQFLLVAVLTPAVGSMGGGNTGYFYLVYADDGFHFYSVDEQSDEIEPWFDDPTLIEMGGIFLVPKITTGPIPGILDFYEQSTILTSAKECSRGPGMSISESDLPVVYQGFLNLAKTDPWLKQYHPGGPPGIRFLPGKTLFSLFKVGLFFGFPVFLIWLLRKSDSKLNPIKSSNPNLCIHCTYDCKDLPSPTCPECGQPHTIPTDHSILESNA